ncbi:sulfite exporter TauE/SafE family protein [Mobilicoccus pelagius]|uniref:Probable membrane transporter protein n=1 Tax=Mobilicoccus pelagius NBRC 104925 TaxID=1089455 RepID=H5UU71_9MICO|nr:sulfite exporter TauE/SafE family protein [Mobilicoccus pelagius]GAB49279.1 hypothetical protein MOPEL_099_00790 [Mobilicoccus pelagius NBRC 104925]
MSVLLPVVIGLGVGVVVGALGAGGGILAVPVLVHLLGQSPQNAATGSLVLVVLTALTSLPARARDVRWRDGLVFGALSIVGSFAGARLSVRVDPTVLMVLFTVLLAGVAIAMLRRSGAPRRARRATSGVAEDDLDTAPGKGTGASAFHGRPSALVVAAAATVTGLLTGLFGVGGGFAVVPALTLVLGFGMHAASGTSLLAMILSAGAALAGRWDTIADVDWAVPLLFAGASMVGGLLGTRVSRRADPAALSRAFGVLLLVVAVANGVATALEA